MHTLTVLFGAVFLVSFMAALGLRIGPGQLSAELSHPGKLARGFVLALLAVPIATLLVVRTLGVTGAVATGLVIVAVCPGPPLAPSTAKKAHGSPTLALALTVFFSAVTVFTAAPSARALLRYEGELSMEPPLLIAKLTLLQWIPLAAGALLRRYAPDRAVTVERLARALFVASGLAVVVLAIGPVLPKLGMVGWRGLVAILVSMLVAVALAWLAGGHDHQLSRTLAATISVPNVGLAVTMANAAGATRIQVGILAAIFVVRVLANVLMVQILGRVEERPATPVPAGPLHGSPQPQV